MNRVYSFALVIVFIFVSCERDDVTKDNFVLKLYGDVLEDIGYSISKTENGYFIAGQFTNVVRTGNSNYVEKDSSTRKMAIIKADLNGKAIWKKSFGNSAGAVGTKVIALPDGSCVCLGYIVDPVTKQKNIYVTKVSSEGELLIENNINANGQSSTATDEDGNQLGIDLVNSGEGFMLLCSTDASRLQGSTGNVEGKSDILLMRLNDNLQLTGDVRIIGFQGNDDGVAIKKIPGGYLIVGSTERSEPGQSLSNILLAEVNYSGSLTRMKILGSEADEYASDVEIEDDGYFIAGTVGKTGADQSVYVCKVPFNIYDTPYFQMQYKLQLENATINSFAVEAISKYKNSSYVFAGYAGSGSSAKMLVFSADCFGSEVKGMNIITSADGSQIAYDVISDENNKIIVVGKSSFESNSMISFYKFWF